MKSLQNITKETAYYRGKEITHCVGFSSFMMEFNKLQKKYNRSYNGNTGNCFDIEIDFATYIGTLAENPHASWDAIGHNGKKWEIRTRNSEMLSATIHFMSSSAAMGKQLANMGAVKEKCAKVDMFLVADTARSAEKGLLEWWEIPSKSIVELYNRKEFRQGMRARKCNTPMKLSWSRF